MTLKQSIIEQLASKAIRVGADALDIEYKGGYEEVFAMCGSIGHGIARLQSTSPEAEALRAELQAMVRRNRNLALDDREYKLRCRVHESFGEDAYRVEIIPVNVKSPGSERISR